MILVSRVIGAIVLTATSLVLSTDRVDAIDISPPLLITFGDGAGTREGDHDHRQLVRFSVPLGYAGRLYVRVFDADTGGSHDEALGGYNTRMLYALYGGGGSAKVGRDAKGVVRELTSGSVLSSVEIGRDRSLDGKWSTLFEVNASDGKAMGERREFFLLVEGISGNDGNVFDVRISTEKDANKPPSGGKLYSFLPTVRMPNRGRLTEMRFNAPRQGNKLTVENFDSAKGIVTFAGRFRSLPLKASGQDEWQASSIVLEAREKGDLVSVTLGDGREIPNDATFYMADDQDRPVAVDLPPRSFRPNRRPVIGFTQTPQSCTSVQFDAGGSSDPERGVLSYRWEFHDGMVKRGAVVTRDYGQPGTYKARLEVFDDSGMVASGRARDFEVFVKAPPVALFTAPKMVAQGGDFTLDASASKAPALPKGTAIRSYDWEMGNGDTISSLATVSQSKTTTGKGVTIARAGQATARPLYSYPNNGAYTIRLKVTDTTNHPCNTATTTRPIYVNAPPIANAGGDRKVGHGTAITFDAGGSSDLDGDVLTYSWNLGDGTKSGKKSLDHSFKKPGTYHVTLTVDDGRNVSNSRQNNAVEIFVNASPVAKFELPSIMITGQPALFDASASLDPDGKLISTQWHIGVGKTVSRAKFRHAYFEPGNYQVILVLKDNSGLNNDTTKIVRTIKVVDRDNEPPVARAGGDLQTIVDDVVRFDGSKSIDPDGSILTYTWDFGDGKKASGEKIDHVYRRPGTFSGSLTVTDSAGKPNSIARDAFAVIVKERPNEAAKIRVGGDRSAYVNEVVAFDATGTTDLDGNIISYEWDFGDGAKASGFSVRHSYRKPGTYKVHLVVNDDSDRRNQESEASFNVTVVHAPNLAPVANILEAIEAATEQILVFDGTGAIDRDGNIVSWHWDLGDGHQSDKALVSHAYARAGTYFGKLTLTDNSGLASGTAVKRFVVLVTERANVPPVAEAGDDVSALVGDLVELTGKTSSDPDGSVIRYEWEFGNGKSAVGETVRIAYFKPGSFTVTLTVTDNSKQPNARSRDTLRVTVTDQPNASPIAAVEPDRPSAIDEIVQFTGGSSSDENGNIIAYEWDLGDGTRLKGREIAHAYRKSGTYIARLRITDDSGLANNSAVAERTITVNEPPVADAGPNQHVTASVVNFDASASVDLDGKIIRYSWNFGDGKTGEGRFISHTYREPGTFVAKLEIEDDSQTIRNTANSQMQVTVNALPVADAGPDIVLAPGEMVTFDGRRSLDPDGKIGRFAWDFRDGSVANGAVVQHSFAKPGKYFVQLKVADDTGHENATDFSQTQVIVNATPIADAGSDIVVAPGDTFTLSGEDSYDDDGEIADWRWDFSDGNTTVTTSQVTRKFEKPGIYRAILTVSDGSIASNNTHQDELEIFVNHGPVAEAGKDQIKDVLRITLDGTASADADNDGLTYRWNLGDGNIVFGPNIEHTYQSGGVFPVVLTVDDGRGLANSVHKDSTKVTINRSPVSMAGADQRVCVGDIVVFDGSESRDPDSGPIRYNWNFGDGLKSDVVNPTKVFEKPGTYQVQLTVEDDSGLKNNRHRDSLLISVDAAPVADAGEPILACANTEIQFDGSKSTDIDGVVNRFNWDFGDGASGGGDRPKHIYTTSGTYRATLLIEGDNRGLCSPSSTDELLVKIVNAPRGVISAADAVALGAEIKFDGKLSYADGGSISEYVWNFGDGQIANGVAVEHRYEKAGTYRVGLTVKARELEEKCQSVTTWHVVKVNDPPVADAGSDREVEVNRALILSGAASRDPDGGITSYRWDFGDGSKSTGLEVRHAWRKPGRYTVKLTVIDQTDLPNNRATSEIVVNVKPAPETRIVTSEVACAGQLLSFSTAALPAGTDTSQLNWRFGDGKYASGNTAKHAFARPGTYSVSVGGPVPRGLEISQSYATKIIKVNRPPVAAPGANRKACPGVLVQFDASRSFDVDGNLTGIQWDFGDGNRKMGEKVGHAFARPGTYKVALTVTDDSGSSCSATTREIEVFVNSPPVADGGPDLEAWVGGARDRFSFDASASSDPDGDALDYFWELSTGEELDGEKPSHLFSRSGDVTVKLTAADEHDLDCSYSTDTIKINVRSRDLTSLSQ